MDWRVYRDGLLEDAVPFWMRRSVDREHGGFLTFLDRDGSVYGTEQAGLAAGPNRVDVLAPVWRRP